MAEGHNTSLPPSRAQALSSSPSKTKTKAEEELFVLKMVEENVAPRRRSARQQVPKVHVQTGRFRPVSDRYPQVQLLKRHLPYHESDHVLNLAYNALLDGQQLEDIEVRRNDEAFLDGLGAQRIPDPTTSGDFTRRFDQGSILDLMEAINTTRQR